MPSRRPAALAVAALLVPLFLAGCLSDDEPEEVEAAGTDADATAGAGGASASADGGKATATAKPGNATATAKGANATAATAKVVPKVELAASAGGIWPVNPTESVDKDSIPSGAEVHVVFKNGDTNPLGKHNWVLEGVPGAETEVVDAGMSAEATFTAPAPGEYAFYCSVGEHRSQGMEGKLTVT